MMKAFFKERLIYFIAVIITMAAGLASRRFGELLPNFVHEHFGDALWAAMIYFGVRMVWMNRSKELALIVSLLFSWAVECSQMIQTPLLNEVRSTVLGALILGRGFLVMDLLRYGVGILCVYGMDRYFLRNKKA
ncbi:ribosomal maturation YjgA family protein [Paenibacillus taichungensis]|uniref:ribosomal maturation YjgA family protein n=1 Tax=Paenibacillus taichungensis TaxID=484184 RepID=UPI0035E233EB